MKAHQYHTKLTWTGNSGAGTRHYTSYERSHIISVDGKPEILCSSDPSFRGDSSRYNPEELFVASLSSCHMLWYLHLCAVNHVVVTAYSDAAAGTMTEHEDGSGKFTEVALYPVVTVAAEHMMEKAIELHQQAHRMCFIANSCNFPVTHHPSCLIAEDHLN